MKAGQNKKHDRKNNLVLVQVCGIIKKNIREKDQIILATERGVLADFWVPHEIESCTFQNLLVFRFSETSQNLISFRQPFEKSKSDKIAPAWGQDDLILLCIGTLEYQKIMKKLF